MTKYRPFAWPNGDRRPLPPFWAAIAPYLASIAVMALCLTVLAYVPLDDQSQFTVFLAVLLGCCWFSGLGPSIATCLFALVWLRTGSKGIDGLLDFTQKEVLDVTVLLLISTVVGWSGQSRRRAEDLVRRHAAQSLEASEERFRLLVEGTEEYAIIMLDQEGRVASWNTGAERIQQYRAGEIVGEHFSRFYTADDVRAGKPAKALEIATVEPKYEEEGLRVRKDGNTFWASVVITALKDNEGNLRGFSKITRDITLRKQAEETARRLDVEAAARKAAEESAQVIEAEKERFRVTLTSIGDAVITTDAQGRVTFLNPVAEALTGWSSREADGQPLTTVFHIANEATRQPVESPVEKVILTGRIVGLANHTLLFSRDGAERPIDDSAAPIRDRHGEICGVVLVFRDISAKRRSDRELAEALEQLRIVTESMSVPVARCSRELTYVWVNNPYAQWVGHRPEEIVGRSIREVLGEEAFGQLLPHFQQVLSGRPVRYEDELQVRGVGPRWVSAVYTPTTNAEGTVDGWVAVVFDTTERKRLELQLKDADRRKSEFLATLAHELRNPLAPIQSSAQILKLKEPTDPDLKWCREVIDRQVQHMARLLDDLLDVSRITYNKFELRKVRIELATVLERAVEVSRPLIDEAQHAFSMLLPPEPVYLEADPTRLAQVFWNLLNNAARYTTAPGRIELIAERQGNDVVVSVKDNGIGLPPEAQAGIFEMFSQAKPALERLHSGLGIGLSLARALVELHGGSIQARSDGPGKGSEFTVRLPAVAQDSVPAVTPTAELDERDGAATYRVLVVDDLKDAADSLSMLVQLMNHEVRTAYDGEEALAVADAFRPDVVILDIGLPKLNGYEVASRMRAEPWGERAVLIALTGWGQKEDKDRTRQAGFDHHLTKPVSNDVLQKLLAAVGR